jgi:ubiquinone/menaquinone biosynthesis C-methylase UbiE
MFFCVVGMLAGTAAAYQQTHPITQRQIAGVMSAAGASWLERPEREAEENPELALRLMGIKKGMVVADVGCGSGYFTRRIARLAGSTGKVYGVDIQPRMLELLEENIKREKLTNVEAVLGAEDDPRLPANQVDLVLMVDVYHELARPQVVLGRIREALKPDGRLVLLEYRKEDPNVPIRLEHKMTVEEVKTELAAEGFRLAELKSELPRQHVLIFRKNLQ